MKGRALQAGLFLWMLLVGGMGVHAQVPNPPDRAALQATVFLNGLNRPLYLTHANDQSERVFVVEQGGKVYAIGADGAFNTFMDVSNLISADALNPNYTERGLLGLAFHPQFASNGTFFINYTEANTHDTIVARYQVSADDPNRADPTSAVELLRLAQPYPNHNGGHMAFGADGYLYISVGDGGSAGDPQNYAQQTGTLLGKILRIDVDAPLYAIPADNPFVNDPASKAEIWAYGVRNVWRFSFDRANGDLYLGDVGQNTYEEINYHAYGTPNGANYGWRIYEGLHYYTGGNDPANLVLPIAEYSHADGHCSVTGGYVYRGEKIPSLQGVYFFGDFCSGQIWTTYRDTSDAWQTNRFVDSPYRIASFGEDEGGELYIVDYSGQIIRLDPSS
ncbi:MAG: PQQ-dependent sugar dehydrogenase [Phototrophicaceae bacterium]